jgi:FkbM family methyltransferase
MKTIIEVGMNDGRDTVQLLNRGDVIIYGFEPTNELLVNLYEKFKNENRVKIIPLAVDIENKFTTFNIAGWQDWGCSSLNDFSDGISDRFGPGGFNIHFTKQQPVMTIRLDDFCKLYGIKEIDFLWIDAQGSDFNVLKSLGSYIDNVKQGKVEVSYNVELYQKVDNTFESVSKWLTEKGFTFTIEYDDEKYKNEANLFFTRK